MIYSQQQQPIYVNHRVSNTQRTVGPIIAQVITISRSRSPQGQIVTAVKTNNQNSQNNQNNIISPIPRVSHQPYSNATRIYDHRLSATNQKKVMVNEVDKIVIDGKIEKTPQNGGEEDYPTTPKTKKRKKMSEEENLSENNDESAKKLSEISRNFKSFKSDKKHKKCPPEHQEDPTEEASFISFTGSKAEEKDPPEKKPSLEENEVLVNEENPENEEELINKEIERNITVTESEKQLKEGEEQEEHPDLTMLMKARKHTGLSDIPAMEISKYLKEKLTPICHLKEESFKDLLSPFKPEDIDEEAYKKDLDDLFFLLDSNKNKMLERSEAANVLILLGQGTKKDKIEAAFEFYDADKNNLLNMKELTDYFNGVLRFRWRNERSMKSMDELDVGEMAENEAKSCFKQLKIEEDGEIDLERFREYALNIKWE